MADLNMIKPIGVQNLINKFCCTIGMLPTSYKESLTYEEQILAIGHYLETVVYPAINNNAEALTELQGLFVALEDYVNNYFDNLDVQEEINNKLDEMAESGDLEEIIAAYINTRAIFGFDTVDDMKSATNLMDGSFARTYGTDTLNDGVMYFYKIREIKNTDVVDNIQIIAMDDDNLVAERISSFLTNDRTNPIFYGADPTGQTDSSTAINNCILANKGGTINFSSGTYLVNQTINLPYKLNEKVSINGNGAKLINTVDLDRLIYAGYDKGTESDNDVGFPCYIKDLYIDGSQSNTTYCIDVKKGFKDFKIFNCRIFRFVNGLRIGETTGTPADVLMEACLLYGKGSEYDGTGVIANCTDSNINMCRIYGFRKGFIINGATIINKCQVLLRWANQTSANFDPYTRNGTEWNNYYPQTMYAEVNEYFKCIDCYGDSVYKMLDIKTNQPVIVNDTIYYNARDNVDNRIFDLNNSDNFYRLIINNFTCTPGVNTECEIIHRSSLIDLVSQIYINNIILNAITRLTNWADLALTSFKDLNYTFNKNLTANTWYVVKAINNIRDYTSFYGDLFINDWKYEIKVQTDVNGNASNVYQLLKGSGKSNWTVGFVTINRNLLICIKPTNNTDIVKFDYKTRHASNICFDVTPVKGGNIAESTRLLSDYTNVTPAITYNLENVLS